MMVKLPQDCLRVKIKFVATEAPSILTNPAELIIKILPGCITKILKRQMHLASAKDDNSSRLTLVLDSDCV